MALAYFSHYRFTIYVNLVRIGGFEEIHTAEIDLFSGVGNPFAEK